MRILHVDTERGWRGGERQALWLSQELARRGHLSVIAARPDEPLAQRARDAGLEVVSCTPAFEVDPRAAFQLRRAIRRARIDIVHAHTAHAVGQAALATLGLGTRVVVARRVDFHLRPNAGTRWKYARADAIVAVSRAVAAVLASDGIDLDRITVVPDATDIHRPIVTASRTTLQSLGVSSHAPLVVQVAQLVPHKDPLNFVRAVAAARTRVPALQALLVGDGALRAQVEAERTSLGLTSTLHLAGYRTDADELLAAAHVVVLSSRQEGMGSVLLDALLLGKPIAATRAGGIPDVIQHGVDGLLAPVADPDALAAHIVELLTNRALAARLATAARSRAVEFSVERMTDRTLDVYERILTASGRATREEANRRAESASRARSASSTRAP
jgi:glycosyltransferase involved in cell wall biosynthesis